MKVLFFRHGEKEHSFDNDPNLTLRGQSQAKTLAKLVAAGNLPAPTKMISSPKRRALQTFEPLAKEQSLKIELNSDLLEKTQHESLQQFRDRVLKSIQYILQEPSSECVYVVSHMDWLEEVLLLLPSDVDFNLRPLFWAPCQYIEFEVRDHLWCFLKSKQITAPES